jgi:hypothetical protein
MKLDELIDSWGVTLLQWLTCMLFWGSVWFLVKAYVAIDEVWTRRASRQHTREHIQKMMNEIDVLLNEWSKLVDEVPRVILGLSADVLIEKMKRLMLLSASCMTKHTWTPDDLSFHCQDSEIVLHRMLQRKIFVGRLYLAYERRKLQLLIVSQQ